MKIFFASLLIFFAGSFMPFWVYAATLSVPGDYTRIEDAVNAANNSDTIEIASDTYDENNIVIAGKTITIKSVDNNPDACIINCNSDGRAFNLYSGANVTLSGLTVRNGKFTLAEGGVASGGGAIFADGSSLALENCIFKYNYVRLASQNDRYKVMGGAVYMKSTGNLFTCENCKFTTNSAEYGYGGALYINGVSSDSWIRQSTFENNGGPTYAVIQGGALYCNDDIEIDECRFTNNYCSMNGGGIYLKTCSVDMVGGVFTANQALDSGGALSSFSSQLTIKKSANDLRPEFTENQAVNKGGAIFMGGSFLNLQSCDFSRNYLTASGSSGGAVYVSLSGEESLSDCRFEENRAVIGGGMYTSNGGEITLKDCLFKDNGPDGSPPSSSMGGGVYLKLASQTTCLFDRCEFVENSAYRGGGMYFKSGTILTDYNTVLAGVSNCLFEANRADLGGALYVPEHSPAYLRNSTFVGNSASSFGGGIWFFHGDRSISTLELVNSILWGNQVDSGNSEDGPQIYITNDKLARVQYCNIEDGCDSEISPAYNISSSPNFIDYAYKNFRLQDNSSCRDVGTNQFGLYPSDDDRDLDNRNRPVDIYDMGAYEVLDPLMVTSFSSTGDSQLGLLKSYTLTCEFYSRNGTALFCDFDFGDTTVLQAATITPLLNDNFRAVSPPYSYVADNTYNVSCSVSDEVQGPEYSEIIQITTTNLLPTADAGNEQVIVSTSATLDGDGTDPDGDDALSYSWSLVYKDFADVADPSKNKSAVGKTPTVTGLEAGIYDVTLTVSDSSKSGTDTTRLTVAGEQGSYQDGYDAGETDGYIDGLSAANCDVCAGGPITEDSEGVKHVTGPVLIENQGLLVIR